MLVEFTMVNGKIALVNPLGVIAVLELTNENTCICMSQGSEDGEIVVLGGIRQVRLQLEAQVERYTLTKDC